MFPPPHIPLPFNCFWILSICIHKFSPNPLKIEVEVGNFFVKPIHLVCSMLEAHWWKQTPLHARTRVLHLWILDNWRSIEKYLREQNYVGCSTNSFSSAQKHPQNIIQIRGFVFSPSSSHKNTDLLFLNDFPKKTFGIIAEPECMKDAWRISNYLLTNTNCIGFPFVNIEIKRSSRNC